MGAPAKVVPIRPAPVPGRSPWGETARRLLRNRLATLGLAVIATMAVAGGLAPLIAPYDPRVQDLHATFQPPSLFHGFADPGSPRFLDLHSHVLGTDNLGRDWLSRLMYGARLSMAVGIFAQVVVLAIGIPIGLAGGYFGGRLDSLLMRFTDMMYAFPELLLIILLRSVTGGSPFMLFLVIGLSSWTNDARLLRGQVLALKGREFVEAARAAGARDRSILWRHLLPNAAGPLIVATSFGVPRAVFVEATLSFMGIGVSPGTPSWGSMVQDGYQAVFAYPHLVLAPSVAISVLMMSFTFLGDGLRDALDPRTRRAVRTAEEAVGTRVVKPAAGEQLAA